MEKCNYETPEMIIIPLGGDDIIVTSNLTEGNPDQEGSEEWGELNWP